MAPSITDSGDARAGRPLLSRIISPFQITTPLSEVTLDAANQAVVSFTVLNSSGSAILANATPRGVDPDPARPGWPTLQIDGPPEWNFPIGGQQQYRVRVQAKPS